ncbi:MAG: Ig-like domain-containing protein, partial [Flavobacteriaceae bacterium]|nr:Ig-like domain-containing protein [Flavobacteriaceae bacterium]
MKKAFPLIIIFLLLISVSCANRGNPSGGERDTTPPEIVKSDPENLGTNFTADEIEIQFDEYVKIKELSKNLIISPPMDPEPQITPLGSASKKITIKIYDTLRPNTTYALNFGESIVDNNEENPFPFYKYVFSTGGYIDSLTMEGGITDALDKQAEEFVSVMLYEVDSTYSDSLIYKEKPDYITNTLDSLTTYKLENLKPGKYRLIALKDENSDFTFDQAIDKIGFVEDFIEIPTDQFYDIQLFKEKVDFKAFRPRLSGHQKIAFGYAGDPELMDIKLITRVPDSFNSRITQAKDKDTLSYWFRPKLELDSLIFKVSGPKTIDTFTVRLKDQLKDSLVISPFRDGPETFEKPFEIDANLPLTTIDRSQIKLIDKDSADVSFNLVLDSLKNRLRFEFEKTESNNYRLKLYPGALTDFFENTNDTLSYSIRTKAVSDYGNLRLIPRN